MSNLTMEQSRSVAHPFPRRQFLRAGVAGLFTAMAGSASVNCLAEPELAADKRSPVHRRPPNVILLLSDDQRWDLLGCMGHPVLQTPHLDSLAAQGTRFTQACVTTAICCSSRASILSGQTICRHGITGFDQAFAPEALDQTWPAIMRRQGYYTGLVGKYGLGSELPDQLFDYVAGNAQLTPAWVTDSQGRPEHALDQDQRHALEFLRNVPTDRPFCLLLGYNAPHAEDANPRQYLPHPREEQLYRDARIHPPPSATEAAFADLPPFLQNSEGRRRWKLRFAEPRQYQEMVADYFRLISGMDRTIGRLREELQHLQHSDDTVIIFTSDNGYFLGEHGLADKWFPYQESIRVPLIIHDPRLPASHRGGVCDALALNIDLAPTLLDVAGIAAPATMSGRSLLPLLNGDAPGDWRQDFFYEHPQLGAADFIPASQAVVSRDWKYILWADHDYEELFDLRADPCELQNRAEDPAPFYRAQIQQLRSRMRALQGSSST